MSNLGWELILTYTQENTSVNENNVQWWINVRAYSTHGLHSILPLLHECILYIQEMRLQLHELPV